MADLNGHKSKRTAWVLGIALAGATLLSSWVAIWQTSHYQAQTSIYSKLDKLNDSIRDLQITVAINGQRLDDYIKGNKP